MTFLKPDAHSHDGRADNRPYREIERRRFAGNEWRKLLVREPPRVRDGNPGDDERKDTAEKDSHFVKRLGHASTDSISATTSLTSICALMRCFTAPICLAFSMSLA